jgi:V/A-type H+-transporting ATPase subunit F
MKAFVIGDKSVVLGFRLVGIRGETVSDKSEALDTLKKAMSMEDIGIILVTDDMSSQIQNVIDEIRSKGTAPMIVEIPKRLEAVGEPTSTQKLMQEIMRVRV